MSFPEHGFDRQGDVEVHARGFEETVVGQHGSSASMASARRVKLPSLL